eukprot:scaffold32571_cov84-Isochrysis_galbana.AAC.1
MECARMGPTNRRMEPRGRMDASPRIDDNDRDLPRLGGSRSAPCPRPDASPFLPPDTPPFLPATPGPPCSGAFPPQIRLKSRL